MQVTASRGIGWRSFLVVVVLGLMVGWSLQADVSTSLGTAYTSLSGCTKPAPTGWSPQVPPTRIGAAVAYDSSTTPGIGLLFGGNYESVVLGDTWEYNNGCWTDLTAGNWAPCGFGEPETMSSCSMSNEILFNYTGSDQTWVVPTGVTSISATVVGAAGGAGYNTSGYGGSVAATLSVTAGQTLYINVGGAGSTGGSGGWNGGGNDCKNTCNKPGILPGSGGGASDIRKGADTWASVAIVAGGGGGGGGGESDGTTCDGGASGGAGGSASASEGAGGSGASGCSSDGGGGAGGSSTGGTGGTGYFNSPTDDGAAGTCGTGSSPGTGGAGGSNHEADAGGAGGGGGYCGGGGGGAGYFTGGGGGGGSSYCSASCSGVTYSQVADSTRGNYGTLNGYVLISYSGYSSTWHPEPVPRWGASMVWDPDANAFVLYGGCATAHYIFNSSEYEDTCGNYNVLGDLWEFSLSTMTWSLDTYATCSSGFPYTNVQFAAGTTTLTPSSTCQYTYTAAAYSKTASDGCAYVQTFLIIGDTYCYNYGVYGASLVYDADQTQCGTTGQGCILLYGGATSMSTSFTSRSAYTYTNPCGGAATENGYFVNAFCSDFLWLLPASLGSSSSWTLKNDAVASGGTGTATYSDINGLAWAGLTLEPTCSTTNGCTLVLSGGVEQSTTSPYETTVATERYLTGTVATAWASGSSLPVASEGGVEVFDQNSADTSLDNHIVYFGGISSNGNVYTTISVSKVYIATDTPGSAPSAWSSQSLSSPAHPLDDLEEAAAFCDSTGDQFVLIVGGWDWGIEGDFSNPAPSGVYIMN